MLAPDASLAGRNAVSASRKSNAGAKSTEGQRLENSRLAQGISRAALCVAAGIDPRTYERIVSGETSPQRRILVKLNNALAVQPVAAKPMSHDIVLGLYRTAVVTFASLLGADPQVALVAKRLPNFSAAAVAAGQARRLAFYVVVNAFHFERPQVSAAAGYSKQAASKALREIEDARESDASLDAMILRVGLMLTGKDLT